MTVSKTKYPGICNNCANKSEFYIRCGVHTLQLCGTCAMTLGAELKIAVQQTRAEEPEYNHSVETGLIRDPSGQLLFGGQ